MHLLRRTESLPLFDCSLFEGNVRRSLRNHYTSQDINLFIGIFDLNPERFHALYRHHLAYDLYHPMRLSSLLNFWLQSPVEIFKIFTPRGLELFHNWCLYTPNIDLSDARVRTEYIDYICRISQFD